MLKITLFALVFCFSANAQYLLFPKSIKSVVLEKKSFDSAVEKKHSLRVKNIDGKFLSVKASPNQVKELSEKIHKDFGRCGGFFQFPDLDSLKSFHQKSYGGNKAKTVRPVNYKSLISKKVSSKVKKAVDEVSELKIRKTIEKLSSYKNRIYDTEEGVKSAKWIYGKWKSLVKNRPDISVSLFDHQGKEGVFRSIKQKSVILKIPGVSKNSYVFGGHLDSIHKHYKRVFGRSNDNAPGADDNASGIATLTEIIRILVSKNFKPKNTLYFMGYAAEEIGLIGSRQIAQKLLKNKNHGIKGAVQFDLTNYRGSDKEIYFIRDYVSKGFTEMLINLTEKYVTRSWGYSRCGYPCSDHASWNALGVEAAFPTESAFSDINSKIHTERDTLEVSKGVADHSVNFAKLGVAAALELGVF